MSVTPCDFLSRAIGIEGSLGDLLESGFPFTAFMNPTARKGGRDFSPANLKFQILDLRFQSSGKQQIEGFDPGSERTLAAWIRHASRGRLRGVAIRRVTDRRKG